MKILSLKEVSKFLGVTERTITRWIKEEGFPHLQAKKHGKHIFVQEKVIAWLEKRSKPI